LVIVKISDLAVKFITRLASWDKWHLISVVSGTGIWDTLWRNSTTCVNWAALAGVFITDKFEYFSGLAVGRFNWELVSAIILIVVELNLVVSITLVNLALVSVESPGLILVLDFRLVSHWISPDALFWNALDKSLAAMVLFGDSDVVLVWTVGWWNTGSWVAFTSRSTALIFLLLYAMIKSHVWNELSSHVVQSLALLPVLSLVIYNFFGPHI
jgi:hypothetical protein